MPKIPRMLITGESTAYHVMSRTALDGLPSLEDSEKEFLMNLMKTKSRLFFAEIIGFCCMGNHFHLLVRMYPESKYTDDDIRSRFERNLGQVNYILTNTRNTDILYLQNHELKFKK